MFLVQLMLTIALSVSADENIENLNELYQHILDGDNKNVGFISAGNYHTNQHLLPDSTVPFILNSIAELEQAVENNTIVAALITGVPSDDFHWFSNDLVTLQAPLFGRGVNSTDLVRAIDAAVVRVIEDGKDVQIAKSNPPFELIGVHTCGTSDGFDFPVAENATGLLKEVLDTGILKVAALGPYDWADSGNYTNSPPTGFWPMFLEAVVEELNKAYPNHDIQLERVWNAGSDATLALVESEQAHMSEPYFLVSGYYPTNGIGRKEAFRVGCTILGKDSKFFTKKHYDTLQNFTTVASSNSGDDDNNTALIIGVVIAAVVALVGVILVIVLVRNEKKGKPIFSTLYES